MKKTILIVDDESGIRVLLKEMFLDQGYRVLTAKNGKESLKIFEKEKIDLMIIDYNLPIINGEEVISALEKNNVSTPVILMSGMVENVPEDVRKNRLILSSIGKPFDVEDLLHQVASISN